MKRAIDHKNSRYEILEIFPPALLILTFIFKTISQVALLNKPR